MVMKQPKGKFLDLNLWNVILLDNQSMMSFFCNTKLVTIIPTSLELTTLQSNVGSMKVSKVATIGNGKPDVWFSHRAITNILSMKDVISCYGIMYDTYNHAFVVWREDSGLPNMIFNMHSSGLHFYNTTKAEFGFVITVKDNMKLFTTWQIVGVEKACNVLAGLAFPSDSDYNWKLKSNQVHECPVTSDNATVADKIWGINVASLKGKTTRKTLASVLTDIIKIPRK